MALALDNTILNSVGSGSSGTRGYNVTTAGDIVILYIAINLSASGTPPTVTSVSDDASLTWANRKLEGVSGGAFGGSTSLDLELWWAYSAGTLSSKTITAHFSTSVDNYIMSVFTVKGFTGGSYSTNPWDSNASLPAANSQSGSTTAPTVSGVSTTSAATMMLALYGGFGNIGGSPPSGFTSIGSQVAINSDVIGNGSGYEVFSSAQTNQTETWGSSVNGWAYIVDALSQTGATVTSSAFPVPPIGIICGGF